MRLLLTSKPAPGYPELRLQDVSGSDIPEYAIRSHTWTQDEEVVFADFQNETWGQKQGLAKVRGAIQQAKQDGYDFIWIDSCCVDKTSSAELSEAINSMFTWYEEAATCYAYLSDVTITPDSDVEAFDAQLHQSRWWTRGWTLQELLAPAHVEFFDQTWRRLGNKHSMSPVIYHITQIDEIYLSGDEALQSASIAKRMSWASYRYTTRPEDIAYCLLGLFSVNMPLLYGEGNKAFLRLQEEILKSSDDQSLFAWKSETHYTGFLASHPSAFKDSGPVIPFTEWENRQAYLMTNMGLRIDLTCRVLQEACYPDRFKRYIVALACRYPGRELGQLGLIVEKLSGDNTRYARVECSSWRHVLNRGSSATFFIPQLFNPRVRQTRLKLQDNFLYLSKLLIYDAGRLIHSSTHDGVKWKHDSTSFAERKWEMPAYPDEAQELRVSAKMGSVSDPITIFPGSESTTLKIFFARTASGDLSIYALQNGSPFHRSPILKPGLWAYLESRRYVPPLDCYTTVTLCSRSDRDTAAYDATIVVWVINPMMARHRRLTRDGTAIKLEKTKQWFPDSVLLCAPLVSAFNEPSVWVEDCNGDGYSVLTFNPNFRVRKSKGILAVRVKLSDYLTSPPVQRARILWQWHQNGDNVGETHALLHREELLRVEDLFESLPSYLLSDSSKLPPDAILLDHCELHLDYRQGLKADLIPRKYFAIGSDEYDKSFEIAVGARKLVDVSRQIRFEETV